MSRAGATRIKLTRIFTNGITERIRRTDATSRSTTRSITSLQRPARKNKMTTGTGGIVTPITTGTKLFSGMQSRARPRSDMPLKGRRENPGEPGFHRGVLLCLRRQSFRHITMVGIGLRDGAQISLPV